MAGLIEEQSFYCVDVLGVNQNVSQLWGLLTVVAQFHAWHQGEKKSELFFLHLDLGCSGPGLVPTGPVE